MHWYFKGVFFCLTGKWDTHDRNGNPWYTSTDNKGQLFVGLASDQCDTAVAWWQCSEIGWPKCDKVLFKNKFTDELFYHILMYRNVYTSVRACTVLGVWFK